MEKTLIVINDMQSAGVIGKYAIGGAIAAIFYIEPFATQDIDVFVTFPDTGVLISLDSIYQYLGTRGYSAAGDAIQIEGWPVQFLPAFNTLLEEAVQEATDIDYDGVGTRIFTPEHLIAIMLQTGRPKDILRVQIFGEQCDSIDRVRLKSILKQHDLLNKWYSIIKGEDSI